MFFKLSKLTKKGKNMAYKTSAVRVAQLSPNEMKIIELLSMEERRQVLLTAGRAKLVQLVNYEIKPNEVLAEEPAEKPAE